MTIPAVGAIGQIAQTAIVQPSKPVEATSGTGDGAFPAAMTGAVDELQKLQATSDTLSIAAVTGDLSDIHSATIAATRAQVTLELVAAVRNKGVDAFNEIMRMQA
ncbi:MAG: flagellar hook-basal body complex protein FliE [Leifsonia sp.]